MPNVACRAIFFGASCSQAQVVSVPFKHGVKDFRTLDDLLVNIWMDSLRFPTTSGTSKSKLHLTTLTLQSSLQLEIFGTKECDSGLTASHHHNEALHALINIDSDDLECDWPGSFIGVVRTTTGDLVDVTEDSLRLIQEVVARYVGGHFYSRFIQS